MNCKKNIKRLIIPIILLTGITINITDTSASGLTRTTKEIVGELCSRKYEGRLVGGRGNELAGEYIIGIFKDLELSPWEEDYYYQTYNQNIIEKENIESETEEGIVRNKDVRNIIGIIDGKNKNQAVIISAHFDSIGYKNGRIVSGALDNASGVAAVLKTAERLKEDADYKYKNDIVFVCFNGEESGLQGSKYFAENIKNKYDNLYDINIDCIGGEDSGLICLDNKSRISEKLTYKMKEKFRKYDIAYSDTGDNRGTSDNKSFENNGVPNILISQENAINHIHNRYDTPQYIDYDQIEKLSDMLYDFVKSNDGEVF